MAIPVLISPCKFPHVFSGDYCTHCGIHRESTGCCLCDSHDNAILGDPTKVCPACEAFYHVGAVKQINVYRYCGRWHFFSPRASGGIDWLHSSDLSDYVMEATTLPMRYAGVAKKEIDTTISLLRSLCNNYLDRERKEGRKAGKLADFTGVLTGNIFP